MSYPHTYCSLCGVYVEAYDDDDPARDSKLRWSAAVRAIRARAYVHDPYVTGVGFVAQNHICADADEDKSWKYPGAELVPNDLYNGDLQQQYGCFAVHDFCWKLLRHVVDPEREFPTKTIARQLFAILYNTPAWGSELKPGHDYGGAHGARVHGRVLDDIVASIRGSDLFWILQDPNDEFDLDAGIKTDLPANAPYMHLHGPRSRETDVFSRLPNEVIMLVVVNLPSKSVCDLRLASKHVAAYTPPSLLSQSFWASRFDHDAEMAFAFATRETHLPPKPIDWRQLYHAARSMLTGFQTYPGFRNRRRIWKCLQHIVPIMTLRLQNMENIAMSPYLGRPLRIPEGFAPLGSVSSSVTFEFEKPHPSTPNIRPNLVLGSRLFEKQYLGIPSSAHSQPLRLGASFISLVDQNYICGLRFLTSRGNGQGSELSRAGFINPENERTVEIESLEDVDTMSFHVTVSGIIGLSFQTRIMGMSRTHTIGQFGDCVEDNGVSQLEAGKKLQEIGFVVGLDACKIVSLELAGRESTTESPPSTEIEQIAEVWTPAPPRCRVEWWHTSPSAHDTFNLCRSMDFGGQDGRLLGLLTQVNVFMGSCVHVFLGMSFDYADGTERAYGRKGEFLPSGDEPQCFVQSFAIAGPEGERICQAATSYLPSHDTIQRLSFSTTANRSIEFCMYGDGVPIGEVIEISTRASPGKVFTSFFSLHSSPYGHFRDFSAVEISAGQINNDWSTGDIAIRKYPGNRVRASVYDSVVSVLSSGNQAFTVASLSGLRRIRVSVGNAGYTREPHHISGLKLEYEGSTSVVGQWISEHASMEIGEDERLVEIEVFHHAGNDYGRMKHGPMSGLHITTSKGATMKVMHQPTEGDVRLCFRETPYERLDGIEWSCSHGCDHFRVTSHWQTDMAGRHLYFKSEPHTMPKWAVLEQVFLQEKTADGGNDPLKSIQMTFKSYSWEPAALSFIYRSGRILSLGVPRNGGKLVTETLNDDEQLMEIDIGIAQGNQIAAIEVSSNRMGDYIHL